MESIENYFKENYDQICRITLIFFIKILNYYNFIKFHILITFSNKNVKVLCKKILIQAIKMNIVKCIN